MGKGGRPGHRRRGAAKGETELLFGGRGAESLPSMPSGSNALEEARMAFNRWDIEYVEPRKRVVRFLLPDDITSSSSDDALQVVVNSDGEEVVLRSKPERIRVFQAKRPNKRELRKQRKQAAKQAKEHEKEKERKREEEEGGAGEGRGGSRPVSSPALAPHPSLELDTGDTASPGNMDSVTTDTIRISSSETHTPLMSLRGHPLPISPPTTSVCTSLSVDAAAAAAGEEEREGERERDAPSNGIIDVVGECEDRYAYSGDNSDNSVIIVDD